MQDVVAQERAAGGHKLQASEEIILELRAELAQYLVAGAEAQNSITAQAAELRRYEAEVASQQKCIRDGQHELDAHESMSCLMRERAQEEVQACTASRHAERASEARAT